MDLTTAKYIMDYLYFSRADEPTFQYYKNVSAFIFAVSESVFLAHIDHHQMMKRRAFLAR